MIFKQYVYYFILPERPRIEFSESPALSKNCHSNMQYDVWYKSLTLNIVKLSAEKQLRKIGETKEDSNSFLVKETDYTFVARDVKMERCASSDPDSCHAILIKTSALSRQKNKHIGAEMSTSVYFDCNDVTKTLPKKTNEVMQKEDFPCPIQLCCIE